MAPSKVIIGFALISALLCLAPAPASAVLRDGKAELVAVVRALNTAKQYNTLIKLLKASGMVPVLIQGLSTTTRGYTIIAPTDSAFKALKPALKSLIVSRPALLQEVLGVHVVARLTPYAQFQKDLVGQGYVTVAGTQLQKYKPSAPGKVTIGVQGAQLGPQLVTIVYPKVFQDTIVSVVGVTRVIIPNNLAKFI